MRIFPQTQTSTHIYTQSREVLYIPHQGAHTLSSAQRARFSAALYTLHQSRPSTRRRSLIRGVRGAAAAALHRRVKRVHRGYTLYTPSYIYMQRCREAVTLASSPDRNSDSTRRCVSAYVCVCMCVRE